MEFCRDTPAGNSCLFIVQYPTFLPDTMALTAPKASPGGSCRHRKVVTDEGNPAPIRLTFWRIPCIPPLIRPSSASLCSAPSPRGRLYQIQVFLTGWYTLQQQAVGATIGRPRAADRRPYISCRPLFVKFTFIQYSIDFVSPRSEATRESILPWRKAPHDASHRKMRIATPVCSLARNDMLVL